MRHILLICPHRNTPFISICLYIPFAIFLSPIIFFELWYICKNANCLAATSSIVGMTHGWHIYLRDVIKHFGDRRHLHCYKEITWCYISNVPMAGINYYVIFKK